MAKSLSERYLKKYQNKPAQKQKKLNLYERNQLAMATANLNANKDGIWTARDRKRVENTRAKFNKFVGIEE